MRRKFHFVYLNATLLVLHSPLHAQAPPAPITNAPAPVPPISKTTLADALAQAAIPKDTLIFATYPARRLLPSMAEPKAGDSVSQIATAFGLVTAEYGPVTVLAFPTMTVFNDAPGGADIYADMPPNQILVLLAASLSSDQWGLLTGKTGISDADLSTDEQHAMWAAMWQGRTVSYQMGLVANEVGSDEVKQARLRLGSAVQIRLHNKSDDVWSLSNKDVEQTSPSGFNELRVGDSAKRSVPASAEAPNTAKRSDLDFGDDRLRASVNPAGTKTVGDLIDLIRARTGVEIYADGRMAKWPLLLAGDTTAKPASSLLRALSLAITGVYRRVGPAYVLTSDLTGAGARAQIWRDFDRDVEKLRSKPIEAASSKIRREHGDADLPSFDGALTLNPEQIKAHAPIENLSTIEIPFNELSPEQKKAARELAGKLVPAQSTPGHPFEADLTQKVMLQDDLTVSAFLPVSDKPLPVPAFTPSRFDLFRPSMSDSMPDLRKMLTAQKAEQDAKRAPNSTALLAPLLRQVKRRAVIASPKSAHEAEALLDSMETLGFNELWLSTFTEGEEHGDLLDAVLPLAKQKGIVVYPVMDLFHWGQSAPEDARDVTILGENSLQSNTHWRERSAEEIAMMQQFKALRDEIGVIMPIPDFGYSDLVVSPFSETTETRLSKALKAIAATPGIGGVVWRDTLPPGYDAVSRTFDQEFFAHLGYTLPARLAFLRKWRIDPIDIPVEQTSEPISPDWMVMSTPDFMDMPAKWGSFLQASNTDFLRKLYADAQAAANGKLLPILVQGRRDYGMDDPNAHWFGSWDDPGAVPPALERGDTPHTGPEPAAPAAQASSQSRDALQSFTIQTPPNTDMLMTLMGDPVKDITAGKTHWQGVVLDVTEIHDANPLAKAAAEVTAAAPPVK